MPTSPEQTPWGICNDCGKEIEKEGGRPVSFTHCRKCILEIDAKFRLLEWTNVYTDQ